MRLDFGPLRHLDWDDHSEFVVHFTKQRGTKSPYTNQLSILAKGTLKALNPYGMARKNAPRATPQASVCFSEIPLHRLDRIARKRSRYGIGFSKQVAREKGANPIWYVEKDSRPNLSLKALIARAQFADEPEKDSIWSITPYIDIVGKYPKSEYRFEWEREWRCVGNFCFKPNDVAFLILPEKLHKKARRFFKEAKLENTGPAYFCPFIDSSWGKKKIAKAFKKSVKSRS